MRTMIITTQGCEGLDPQDILRYLPPSCAAGLCARPGAWEEAVAERTTELVSQAFVQIRSITTLLRSVYSAGKRMGIKHTFKPC